MTRARELANFADDTAGLETLTVSDVTDLSVSASNINSATNQITDSSTDLNVDSNTLVVDKSANAVGVGTSAPASHRLEVRANAGGTSETDTIVGITNGNDSTLSDALLNIKNAGNRGAKGHGSGSPLIKAQFSDATAFEVDKDGKVGIGTANIDELLHVESSANTYIQTETTSGTGASGIIAKGTDSNFYVYNQGSSNNLRIYEDSGCDINITPAGKVGIGIAGPNSKLDVEGTDIAGQPLVKIKYSASTNNPILGLINENTGGNATDNNGLFIDNRGGGGQAYSIRVKNNTSEILAVRANGKVGVGTASPTATVHLSGTGTGANASFHNYNTSSATYIHNQWNIAPNMTANQTNVIFVGKEPNTKNSGWIGYKWVGSASNSNTLSFGHWGNDHLMNLTADGKFGIGTTGPTNHLHIRASIGGIGSLLRLENPSTSADHGAKILFTAGESTDGAGIGSGGQALHSADLRFYTGGSNERMRIDISGHTTPGADNAQDFGSSSKRWRNMYTADLQLSNVDTGGNDVDGTEGSWTVQEGFEDLFLINNKSGKQYKFKLEEI